MEKADDVSIHLKIKHVKTSTLDTAYLYKKEFRSSDNRKNQEEVGRLK